MPSNHVFVFTEGPDLLVRPGTVISGKGNNTKVKLRNFTAQVVVLNVPAGVGGAAKSYVVQPKGTQGDRVDIDVDNAAVDGVYDYDVFALTNPPMVGQGGSSPKIIIDG